MSLLDLVQQHLGQPELQQISQQIGTDPATTARAVQAAVPLMVGSVAQTAQTPQGATEVQQAMGQHAGVLGGLGALLGAGPLADAGGGLLSRVLGGHQSSVQSGVEQASGLDSDQTRKLLMMLAPIVLGVLARRHAQAASQNDPAQLGGALRQDAHEAKQQAQQESPHLGGLLGKIIDMAT
jgi:hypothetical protein